jgi:hypothetical protein
MSTPPLPAAVVVEPVVVVESSAPAPAGDAVPMKEETAVTTVVAEATTVLTTIEQIAEAIIEAIKANPALLNDLKQMASVVDSLIKKFGSELYVDLADIVKEVQTCRCSCFSGLCKKKTTSSSSSQTKAKKKAKRIRNIIRD